MNEEAGVAGLRTPHELRYTIPKVLLEDFTNEPRIVIRLTHPAGLWPVDPGILAETNLAQKWANSPEFMENFDVVVMPKEMMT